MARRSQAVFVGLGMTVNDECCVIYLSVDFGFRQDDQHVAVTVLVVGAT